MGHSAPTDRVTLTSVRFRNFKALGEFSLSLRDMNILAKPAASNRRVR